MKPRKFGIILKTLYLIIFIALSANISFADETKLNEAQSKYWAGKKVTGKEFVTALEEIKFKNVDFNSKKIIEVLNTTHKKIDKRLTKHIPPITISDMIIKQNLDVTLNEASISYKEFLDKIAIQTNSKWEVAFGKGVYITFIHIKDKKPATMTEIIFPNLPD